LPAEIRSQIYGYVLGGKVIHIRKPLELGDGPVVCVYPTAPPYLSRLEKGWGPMKSARTEKTSHQSLEYDQPHQNCHESPLQLERFSLGLLSVCRQIYHESVLVPFTDNTFIDDVRLNGPHLRAFLDRLVPIQVKSIKHLILNTTEMSLHCATDLNRLSGLRTLDYIFVPRITHHTFRRELIDFYEKDFGTLNLDKLRLPELTNLRINALEWKRQLSVAAKEFQQVKDWFSWRAVADRELRLARLRAGVTRRRAQQIRERIQGTTITIERVQYSTVVRDHYWMSLRELQDITTWVESVETRMLNALRLLPGESKVSMAV
jgi:hypothetical protein